MFEKLKFVLSKLRDLVRLEALGALPPETRKEVELIKAMQVLEIKTGDVVILKTDIVLSSEAVARLNQAVREHLHAIERNITVFVLEEGMDIGVLRWSAEKEVL